MRVSGKWINIAVLVTFVVSTMPFATHAMMMHDTHDQDMQMGSQIDAPVCPVNTQNPVHDHHHDKKDTTSLHDCECLGINCNSSLFSILIPLSSPDYNLKSDFPVVAEGVKAAHLNRLDRPPTA
jgi:hypothetical protein